jgi:NAD(P)-dependent dehydrogenase (short-subunit alcohol dehydrogenase family)
MTSIDKYRNIFVLTGKTAIVTGGSRGIGEACALALAAWGADVAIVVRSSIDRAVIVANKIRAAGCRSMVIQADVSNERDVKNMVFTIMAEWGRIDILVNNAGILIPGTAEDFTLEDWDRVMNVNVKGVFLCSKIVGLQMITQKSGSIINMGSMSGFIVNQPFYHAAYNASKAAVHQLTKNLAVEWAKHNIRINCIAPGYINTDLTDAVLQENPDVVKQWAEDAVQNCIGSVDDLVAQLIVFASEKASSFTTGSTVLIDGGLTLR